MTTDDTPHTGTEDDAIDTHCEDTTGEDVALSDIEASPEVMFGDIAGLTEEKQRIEETVVQSMEPGRQPRANTTLLSGYENTGVAALGEALARTLVDDGFTAFRLSLDDSNHRDPAAVVSYIEAARTAAPCVLQIDYIGHAHTQPGTQIRKAIDRIKTEAPRVALIGTAFLDEDRPENVLSGDSGVYSEWADLVVSVDRPGETRRRALLRDALDQWCSEANVTVERAAVEAAEDLDSIGGNASLFDTVGKRAVMQAVRDPDATTVQSEHVTAAVATVADEHDCTTRDASNEVQAVSPTVPDVAFDDVGGLQDVKQRVRARLVYPQEYEHVFEQADVSPARGILLYGPPGTGKTLLAKAVANVTDRTFISVQGPELKSMWFGQTEQRLRQVFALADEHAPSVVFFDEFDAIAGSREEFTHEANSSIVATLLAELDGLEDREDVLFLAATNRPDALDSAVVRSGRFGEAIEVPLPDAAGCRDIFEVHAAELPTAPAVTSEWVTQQLPQGVSGADIEEVCERALFAAISDADGRDEAVRITREHVIDAIDSVTGRNDDNSSAKAFA